MKNVEGVHRLIPMQAGMLFHCLAAREERLYVEQYLTALDGDLNAAALKRAWSEVVDCHPGLRTAFVWEGLQEPMQVVARRVTVPWTVLDWTAREDVGEEAFDELLRDDRSRPFTLSQAPLLRLTLIRLAAGRHALLWSVHHLLVDGWSSVLVRQEVAERYRAAITGRVWSAAPAPPFTEYVRWVERQDRGAAERYWRARLQGVNRTSVRLESPATGAGEAGGIVRVARAIQGDALDRIQQAARRHEVTMSTVCCAAWALVIARHTGSEDVLFGQTISCRPPAISEIERTVGLFINTVPARVDVRRRAPVGDLLKEVQARALEARDYEYAPLADVQRWSGVDAGAPLFDSVLAYENFPGGESRTSRGAATAVQARPLASFVKINYPLMLQVRPGEELEIVLVGDSRSVSQAALDSLVSHAAAAVESMMRDLTVELSQVSLLTDGERDQVVREVNAANDGWHDPVELLVDALERQARITPDTVAVASGETAATYRLLHDWANRLAHVLRAEGVGPDTPVAVCLDHGIELVVAFLAVLKAGGAYVPLDPHAPAERAAFILQSADARLLVTDETHAPAWGGRGAQIISVDRQAARLAAAPATPPPLDVRSDHLAYIFYTSGSTGRPKGVGVTHGNVATFFAAADERFTFQADETWTLFHAAGFDLSVWEMWGALRTGGRLLSVPRPTARLPEAFYDLVCREQATVMTQTPSAFRLFTPIDAARRESLALRVIVLAGEALDLSSLRDWMTRRPDRPVVVNMYGITETTIYVTYHVLTAEEVDRANHSPIGRALPGYQIYVVDEQDQPAPLGVSGEIVVAGGALARGYIGRPDLTAERFVPNPFSSTPGGRLYRSGDLGRWRATDTVIACEGRRDHQVKLRGYRIELGEIEAVLRQQPGVRDAVVIVRQDRPGDERLVGYVASDAGEALATGGLLEQVRRRLPDYMVPAFIVPLSSLPLSPSGKVDRARLPEPRPDRPALDVRSYVAPRDALELELVRLWEHLLGAHPIGIRDRFAQLGGHSILMLRLVGQIERRFEIRLQLGEVAQATNIERLAALMRQRRTGDDSRVVPLQFQGAGIPLFAIVPAGGTLACYVALADALGPSHRFYACQPRASLDEQRMASTIEALAREDVRELRRVQPTGPYALAGWSMGGLIAYEMACQLRAAGADVALVALLDVDAPDAAHPVQDPTEAAVRLVAGQLALDLAELDAVTGPARLDALFELAQARGRLANEVDLRWTRWLVDGFRSGIDASQRYRPRPYPGRLLLLRSEAEQSADRDPMCGWGLLAHGGVDVHAVPGTHHTMVEPPHVAVLADLLRTYLDGAAVAAAVPATRGSHGA